MEIVGVIVGLIISILLFILILEVLLRFSGSNLKEILGNSTYYKDDTDKIERNDK